MQKHFNQEISYYWALAFSSGFMGIIAQIIGFPLAILFLPLLMLSSYPVSFYFTFLLLVSWFSMGSLYAINYSIKLPTYEFLAMTLSFFTFIYFANSPFQLNYKKIVDIVFYLFVVSIIVGIVFLSNFYFSDNVLRIGGLTKNPNQVGLYSLGLLILYNQLGSEVKFLLTKKIILIIIGLSSGSDAYFVAMIIWILSFLLVKIFPRYWLLNLCMIALLIFGMIFINIDVIPLSLQIYERVNRWLFFIPLIQESPHTFFIGHGLGNFGPDFTTTHVHKFIDNFYLNVAGTEFHNSFLDYIASFGMLGFLVIFYIIYSSKLIFFIRPSLIALLVFSAFHLTFRHPFFWFVLLIATTNLISIYKNNVRD